MPAMNATFSNSSQNGQNETDSYYNGGGWFWFYRPPPMIDYEIVELIEIVVNIALCGIFAFFGLFANAINMAVFIRQGVMSESSNVSLFGLSVADFLCELFLLWISISIAVARFIDRMTIDFDPWAVSAATAIRPKFAFTQITCWLTAYLAFERCIGVLFPFKVKLIFSPKRSAIAVSCIFLGVLLSYIPLMTSKVLVLETWGNYSWVTSINNPAWTREIVQAFMMMNPVGFRIIAVSIIIISNIVILVTVKASKKWRKSVSSSNSSHVSSTHQSQSKTTNGNEKREQSQKSSFQRERKLVRMITVICVIFIICYFPDVLNVILTQLTIAPFDYSVQNVWYSFIFFLESFNSGINIFIYYFMSTNFKKEFRRMFGINKKV